jgi:hypothetical protein
MCSVSGEKCELLAILKIMIVLESITPDLALTGLDPTGVGTVISVVPIADGAVQVIYRTLDGELKERLLNRADEATVSIATVERPWSFDGDGEAFKLTVEAKRIDLAFLFDPMMAVQTSNVEPLPHQITAVYESMLPRQPLRFVIGVGKSGRLQGRTVAEEMAEDELRGTKTPEQTEGISDSVYS